MPSSFADDGNNPVTCTLYPVVYGNVAPDGLPTKDEAAKGEAHAWLLK